MTRHAGGGDPRHQRPHSPPGRPRSRGISGAEFAGVGLQFAVTIVAFMFLGIWLDRTLHTSPWLLLVCVFGGASAGFYSIYRKLMAAQNRPDEEHE